MIRDFIAIDFETANQQPSSVCSVGVVMVRNGQVADSFYSLIQPEPNYYNYWCQRVHGLSQCDTDDAPVFSKVWQQLEEKIADVFFSDQQSIDDLRYQIASIPFVAHNARFDEGCSGSIRWTILTTAFTIPSQQPADSSVIRCPIISSTLLQPPVVTTFRIIIMPWPMPKPVPL